MTARIGWATTSGSSGKTTSTVTTAAILAERGHRVLIVDGDWQMDASRWLGVDEEELGERATLLDVLLDRYRINEAIGPSTIPGVDLLPASPPCSNQRESSPACGASRTSCAAPWTQWRTATT